jgi:hypothetical protein
MFLLFARSMDRALNHDEHQFLAPAVLLATEGLQPYRDLPLFHLPNQVLLYAAAFRFSDHYVLTAKMLAVLFSIGMAVLVFRAGRCEVEQGSGWGKTLLLPGTIGLVFLLFDPLFCYTTGKTWNHDISAFFALAAVASQAQGLKLGSAGWFGLAGTLAGLAVGTRLTLLPLLPALALTCLLVPTWKKRAALATVLTCGACIALLPSFYYLATAPEAFLFGNLEFPRLRLLDPNDERVRKTMTWWRKGRFFAKEVVLPSWPVFIAFFAFAARPGWRWLRSPKTGSAACGVALVALPALLLGCFLPSRYQYQHYFVLIPVLTYAIASSLVSAPRRHLQIASVLAIVALVAGIAEYRKVGEVFQQEEWAAMKVRALGAEIHRHLPAGKVLTLAPTLPLEGGLRIYPEFATAPFAWRAAEFLEPSRREGFKVVAPSDLESFLKADPPAAILTGVEERELEEPIVAYARAHHFRPVKLPKKRLLWLPPPGFSP